MSHGDPVSVAALGRDAERRDSDKRNKPRVWQGFCLWSRPVSASSAWPPADTAPAAASPSPSLTPALLPLLAGLNGIRGEESCKQPGVGQGHPPPPGPHAAFAKRPTSCLAV